MRDMLMLSSFLGLHANSDNWSVTLLHFQIHGDLPFDLYILTRYYNNERVSELYYLYPIVKKVFFQWVHKYHVETGSEYVLKGMTL